MDYPPVGLSGMVTQRVLAGGMGLVYICFDQRVGRMVAVKRPNLSVLGGDNGAVLFTRECFLWLMLGSHPNIVNVLTVHRSEGETPKVVLEWLPQSLAERIDKGTLTVQEVARLGVEVARAFTYAHAARPGFVHADLKPQNIMLTADHTAKVSDQGESKVS